jgi:galactokinase
MTHSASAPGRICLFGEHQDYLGLPVTAAAINLRCRIDVILRPDRLAVFHLPDLREKRTLDLDSLPPLRSRDYIASVLRLGREEGWLRRDGFDATVRSDIPMAAGTSSSTAFVLALCAALADRNPTQADLVRRAHAAEVVAFNEPGGLMDHASCGFGGLRAIAFTPEFSTSPVPIPAGAAWVLGDSLQPKDTLQILTRAKDARLALLSRTHEGFDLATAGAVPVGIWSEAERALWQATLDNRDISAAGTRALETGDLEAVGAHLSAHHAVLRDALGLSTPRIEAMLEAALKHGALGGKLNGSGGGGCCFVLCHPQDAESIAASMTAAGGIGMPVAIDTTGVIISETP